MMTTHEELCAAVRALDTSRMTTAAVAEACLEAVPSATLGDVAAALRHVAQEHLDEAHAVERLARRRDAGIRGVVRGGYRVGEPHPAGDDEPPPRAA